MAEIYDFKLIITGQGPSQTFSLPIGETVIGRQVGAALLLDHALVSRRHAMLNTSATDCVLTDLGSSNGSYVNGEKMVPQVPRILQPGDKIQIGPFVLVLERQPVQPLEAPVSAAASEPLEEPVAAAPPTKEAVPPAEPIVTAPPASNQPEPAQDRFELVPTGLSIHSQRLLPYLPGIYQTDFMSRFLGIFESILIPIEWNIDNFDLFLDPALAPEEFLPWLANWFGILFQPYWSEDQRREFLQQAGTIFARRGTRAALAAVLKIFTGSEVEINDSAKDLPPYTFRVTLPLRQDDINEAHLATLINANKPAYTSYQLVFKP